MNIVVPVGQMRVGALHDRDSGVGDISVRGGYFLPVKDISIMPALAVKLPAGSFDKNNAVNFGDGQSDIHAELYVNKAVGKFTVDWLLKYSFRLTNHDTEVNAGDEFITEGLITYRITEHMRIGPSFSFVSGGDRQWKGVRIDSSGIRKLSLGGEFFYRASPKARMTFSVLKDVQTRNTAEGTLFLGRITIPF